MVILMNEYVCELWRKNDGVCVVLFWGVVFVC